MVPEPEACWDGSDMLWCEVFCRIRCRCSSSATFVSMYFCCPRVHAAGDVNVGG